MIAVKASWSPCCARERTLSAAVSMNAVTHGYIRHFRDFGCNGGQTILSVRTGRIACPPLLRRRRRLRRRLTLPLPLSPLRNLGQLHLRGHMAAVAGEAADGLSVLVHFRDVIRVD